MGPRREVEAFFRQRFPGAVVSEAGGDASARRYWRLVLPGGSTRVVMDYGHPFQGETDDIALGRIFRAAGLRVAALLEAAPEAGCLVLEDLGERTLESLVHGLVGRPGAAVEIESIYERAVDLAVAIAVRGTPALATSERAAGPALDAERFRFEMDFFLEHYARGIAGLARLPSGLEDALHRLADRASSGPRVLCHRDLHCRNVMVLADGTLATVDIQDARWGPLGYDLASLLRDAYVDLGEDLVDRMIQRFRAGLPDSLGSAWLRARFDVLSIQRMLKMLGTFGYQIHALGRRRYAEAMDRTLRRLERLLPLCEQAREVREGLQAARLLGTSPVR